MYFLIWTILSLFALVAQTQTEVVKIDDESIESLRSLRDNYEDWLLRSQRNLLIMLNHRVNESLDGALELTPSQVEPVQQLASQFMELLKESVGELDEKQGERNSGRISDADYDNIKLKTQKNLDAIAVKYYSELKDVLVQHQVESLESFATKSAIQASNRELHPLAFPCVVSKVIGVSDSEFDNLASRTVKAIDRHRELIRTAIHSFQDSQQTNWDKVISELPTGLREALNKSHLKEAQRAATSASLAAGFKEETDADLRGERFANACVAARGGVLEGKFNFFQNLDRPDDELAVTFLDDLSEEQLAQIEGARLSYELACERLDEAAITFQRDVNGGKIPASEIENYERVYRQEVDGQRRDFVDACSRLLPTEQMLELENVVVGKVVETMSITTINDFPTPYISLVYFGAATGLSSSDLAKLIDAVKLHSESLDACRKELKKSITLANKECCEMVEGGLTDRQHERFEKIFRARLLVLLHQRIERLLSQQFSKMRHRE